MAENKTGKRKISDYEENKPINSNTVIMHRIIDSKSIGRFLSAVVTGTALFIIFAVRFIIHVQQLFTERRAVSTENSSDQQTVKSLKT
ncbi:MAG: hypothetical protein LBF89_06170 [Bacteroidales bacterium]|jgi:hypothetical protein|nr:hypothetical protein [Bacteroidales bacterium]